MSAEATEPIALPARQRQRAGGRVRAARSGPPTDRWAGHLPIPFVSASDAIARRRMLPIHAYVGPNGHFKSATMIRDTWPSLLAGRRVLSTVELLDPATGAPHPLYVPFRHWDQLEELGQGFDLLLDEVVGVANSRESGMPPRIQNILNQLRRRDVLMRWTAPDYARADKIIRETSQAISVCHGYMPDRSAARRAGGDVRAWAPNRLASVLTYDAKDMASFSEGKRNTLRPKIREWYWAPASGVFDLYNTMSAVSQVSYLCPVCQGKPAVKTCRGGHTEDELRGARADLLLRSDVLHEHDE